MASHHSSSLQPSAPSSARASSGAGVSNNTTTNNNNNNNGTKINSSEGKIRAAHLLVKHTGSRRPSSWKEEKITRSKDEAMEVLRGYEERIKSGEVGLGELAASESDCSSARKKGDLYASLSCFH